MAKDYPLSIENIGEDEYRLMSRGHHDFDVFMACVRETGYDWSLGMPEHIWFRAVPGEEGTRYLDAQPGSRGAFPVTYVAEAYGEDQYEATKAVG